MTAREQALDDLVTRLVPYVEDLHNDPAYKPGHVAALLREMHATLALPVGTSEPAAMQILADDVAASRARCERLMAALRAVVSHGTNGARIASANLADAVGVAETALAKDGAP